MVISPRTGVYLCCDDLWGVPASCEVYFLGVDILGSFAMVESTPLLLIAVLAAVVVYPTAEPTLLIYGFCC